ncbi:cysteine sulfinic acid decarboxylase-like [Pecten maximus]|uniref:cysteine sulfinic acid decarboxylase-like n=1 Tax=Pecten maximus TaxID=6579 RepID=UPI001458B256|nr:cysteine sulfinic acid decarboxylase-like [Pecten maximus]XP_033726722.1 cysteine sulfinic acid decarboxylase-like [Pecten maximus]XP_033726729.1 cysteine sulfinic acid decarboxylase-like [Pecten maximus]XP_033726737.1 cysteine sulfinic acid decarboxylase-like [Pecten maximus]
MLRHIIRRLSVRQLRYTGRHVSQTLNNQRTMASLNKSFTDPSTKKFLEDFHRLMINEALEEGENVNSKVCNFVQPEELEKLLDLDIQDGPTSDEKLLELSGDLIKHSVKTGHPRFYNQLYSGKDPYSMAGAWLTDALSTNLHTYEVAPVFVVLEKYMMKKMCSVFGFPNGDGVFCPGGSYSNILALHVARYKSNPAFKQTGNFGSKVMTMFTHADAHYSLAKGASFLGLGMNNLVRINTDDIGRMCPEDLDKKLTEQKSKGTQPIFVMATCGSTVLGSFDDLNAVADVCQKHGVWMHVDAAWGGSTILSAKHRSLMSGVNRADSVAWNQHKMSGVPIQCSTLLMKEKGLLEQCNSFHAEYLFQPDKCYDTSYDIGDKTIQCGRKADVLKLWMQWKAYGDKGMEARVDHAYEMAMYLTQKVKETEGFRLVLPEFQCTNISFWYIPPRLRGKDENEDWWKELAKVAPQIKTKMMMEGTMMTAYQPLSSKGLVNFFRIIIENPLCDKTGMDFIVNEIDRLGRNL